MQARVPAFPTISLSFNLGRPLISHVGFSKQKIAHQTFCLALYELPSCESQHSGIHTVPYVRRGVDEPLTIWIEDLTWRISIQAISCSDDQTWSFQGGSKFDTWFSFPSLPPRQKPGFTHNSLTVSLMRWPPTMILSKWQSPFLSHSKFLERGEG